MLLMPSCASIVGTFLKAILEHIILVQADFGLSLFCLFSLFRCILSHKKVGRTDAGEGLSLSQQRLLWVVLFVDRLGSFVSEFIVLLLEICSLSHVAGNVC
jgi:hypothetical protein